MEKSIQRGEVKLTTISVLLIVIQLGSALFRNMSLGWDELPQQSVQLIIHLVLLYLTYTGKNWARWILTASYLIAAAYGLISGFKYLNEGYLGVILLLYAVFIAFAGLYIQLSSDITRFVRYQNQAA